jgi:alkylhydroperoxidase family enzyme
VVPDALVGFVDLVARDAPGIADADVDAVKAAGFDEEAVFEAIVAAALGASLARLEAVDTLLMGRG